MVSCDSEELGKVAQKKKTPLRNQSEVIELQVKRIGASDGRDAEEIAPYDEAIAWHEYEVENVLQGQFKEKILRVAHWTVIRGVDVDQSTEIGASERLTLKPFATNAKELEGIPTDDDLDFVDPEPVRYIDLNPVLKGTATPRTIRYDYAGNFSDKMELYWHLRSQITGIVLGNSHASRAIMTKDLRDESNRQSPTFLNFAVGGIEGSMQVEIAERYVQPLPKLKKVVWMINGRTFNQLLQDNHRHDVLRESPGMDYDRDHWQTLWPVPETPRVSLNELQTLNLNKIDFWGWTGNPLKHRKGYESPERQREAYSRQLEAREYAFDQAVWQRFEERVKAFVARGIDVFLIVSPIHPLSQTTTAADPDGTPKAEEKKMIEHLQALDLQSEHIYFMDFNRSGHHGYSEEWFYDADHLNTQGAQHFTAWLKTWMEQQQAQK